MPSCASTTPIDLVDEGFLARRSTHILLLASLVLLAVIPRAAMSQLRPVLCTDAVFFLERAAAFERGNFAAGLSRLGLNPYPFVLAVLHGPWLDWETAGRVWSLALASLAVIPLFALTRRLFGATAATVACLLYAVHPELIEWSPEIIRDPTFWFLLLAGLYLSHVAAGSTQRQFVLYALAGTCIALAGLTRFEGWFLIVPLAWWTLAYRRAELPWRACAARLALALAMTPLCLVAINLTLLAAHDRWEWGRFDPLVLALRWSSGAADTNVATSLPARLASEEPTTSASNPQNRELSTVTVEDSAKRPGLKAMCWGMAHTLVRGAHPLYLLAIAAGLWRARRGAFMRDQAPLWLLAAINLGAVWVYFWGHHEINTRYMLLIVLVGLPYAGLGLLSIAEQVSRLVRHEPARRRATFATLATMLLAIGAIGCRDALASGYESRFLKADLGRWIRERVGPRRTLLCSENLERLVGYYARARHASISPDASLATALDRVETVDPDVIVLWLKLPNEQALLAHYARSDAAGFEVFHGADLPRSCSDAAVLVRVPPPTRAGVSLSDRARALY